MRKTLSYLSILLLFASCSTSKKAIREPLKEQGAEYLINKLKSNELKFNTFSAKFTATYFFNRKKTNISGQLRIKRDSTIWISITPMLGIEMARFMLTPDSIKYINRINSTYLQKDFKYINQLLNKTLDFDMAQAFLTGNDFSLYENNKFKASIDNRSYKLNTTNRRKLKRYVRRSEEEISIPLQSIWLDPDQFKITRVVLKEAERDSRLFSAEYSDFELMNEQYIPRSVDYRIETDKDRVRIKIELSKVLLDSDPTFQFVIPESYTEIENFTIK